MGLIARLALADLLGEWVLSLCSAVALAAVLAPLLVLAGLRAGVIEDLRQRLLQDPHAREIVTISNRSFRAAELARIVIAPHVAFMAPRTRSLAASLLMWPDGHQDQAVRVELLPTAAGDPLLSQQPKIAGDLVLSAPAADRLRVRAGSALQGGVARVLDGRRQVAVLTLHVLGVAAPAAFGREAAFVTPGLAAAVEDYQDGIAALTLPLSPGARPRDSFAGFRLYADRLENVPALDASLRRQGIDIVSRAGDVANLMLVDRNLSLLFAFVALLGGCGFLVSLGAGLWANIERKRLQLALLRLLGLTGRQLLLLPILQAACVAACGVVLGTGAALLTGFGINRFFASLTAFDGLLCLLSWSTIALAASMTLVSATLIASAAACRAAGIEPWEGVNQP